MSATETRQAIESILMVADNPVEPSVLAQLLEVPKADVEALCDELAAEYEAAGRGFILARVAGGYRFQSHPDLAPYVERFVLDGQTSRLSSAALETLAIVAYKQPISRMQIAAIRGVNVDGVLRTLQQRGYVDEISRDSGPGNAVLFGTTDLFLERVGLDSTADLPPLGEFVPGADVVEALEDGLRPDPVEAPAPVTEATAEAVAADEGVDADPREEDAVHGTDPSIATSEDDIAPADGADAPEARQEDVEGEELDEVASVEDVESVEPPGANDDEVDVVAEAVDDPDGETEADAVVAEETEADVVAEETEAAAVAEETEAAAVVAEDTEADVVVAEETEAAAVVVEIEADAAAEDVEAVDAVDDGAEAVDDAVVSAVETAGDDGEIPNDAVAEGSLAAEHEATDLPDLDEVIDLVAEEAPIDLDHDEVIERPTELEEELAAIDALAQDFAEADTDETPTWSPAESSVVTTVRHDDPPEAEPATPFRSAPGGLGGAGTEDGSSGQDVATGEDLGSGEAPPLTGSDAGDD